MGHVGKTVTQNIVSGSEITDGTVTGDDLASDIAISTSGAITTTGAFTSKGIDDNADATALTIDSSEVVQVENGVLKLKSDTATLNFRRATNEADIARIQYVNANPSFDIGADGKNIRFTNSGSFGETMRVQSNGLVGIGTTPADMLHVKLSSGQRVARFESNDNTSAHIAFKAPNTSLMPTIGVKDEDLYMSTGDAVEAFRIDANGHVTKPKQTGFMIGLSGGHVTTTGVVPFNNAYFNTGGHFNTSTGVFTAPVTGVYQFNAIMLLQVNMASGYYYWSYTYNGSALSYCYEYMPTANFHRQYQLSICYKMNANDTMSVYNHTGHWYGTATQHSQFSGYLLG